MVPNDGTGRLIVWKDFLSIACFSSSARLLTLPVISPILKLLLYLTHQITKARMPSHVTLIGWMTIYLTPRGLISTPTINRILMSIGVAGLLASFFSRAVTAVPESMRARDASANESSITPSSPT